MPSPVLSVLAQLLSTVNTALRSGKTSVTLQTEELTLQDGGACFGVIDSGVKVCFNC